MPTINPEIMLWARETAGLDREDAARKIGLGPARGLEPEARIEALETGRETPTRAQVARMAKVYRRPLVTFYLEGPPPRGDRGADFRSTVVDGPPEQQAWLDALIREVRARHDLVRAALEEDEETLPVEFVAASSLEDSLAVLRDRLISLIGFDRDQFRSRKTPTDAFQYARECVEGVGVFTLLIGDLGSHHTAISVDTFRGYALADPLAPMIVINDRDARGAWSFTLLHEFCHLMLGQTGVSAGFAALQVERICNDVASAVLLEEHELDGLTLPPRADPSAWAESVSGFAQSRNLSRTLVAYRLMRAGRISSVEWSLMAGLFRRRWLEHRESERRRAKEQDGGPTYYAVRRHRLGPALLGTVNYLLKSGGVSVVKAAKILGVKPNNVSETLATFGT